jgi:hypothetical protein
LEEHRHEDVVEEIHESSRHADDASIEKSLGKPIKDTVVIKTEEVGVPETKRKEYQLFKKQLLSFD